MTAFVLGMRANCEVLIHVDIEQALAGQIPQFGVVSDNSVSGYANSNGRITELILHTSVAVIVTSPHCQHCKQC